MIYANKNNAKVIDSPDQIWAVSWPTVPPDIGQHAVVRIIYHGLSMREARRASLRSIYYFSNKELLAQLGTQPCMTACG